MPCPAYLLTRISDILAVNPEALALIAGLQDWPARRRNTIRYTYLHPAARDLFPDWEASAAASPTGRPLPLRPPLTCVRWRAATPTTRTCAS